MALWSQLGQVFVPLHLPTHLFYASVIHTLAYLHTAKYVGTFMIVGKSKYSVISIVWWKLGSLFVCIGSKLEYLNIVICVIGPEAMDICQAEF